MTTLAHFVNERKRSGHYDLASMSHLDPSKALSPDDPFNAALFPGVNKPISLAISITSNCNLACVHCWVDAKTTGTVDTIPEVTLLEMVEQFAALGGEELILTGGEPLLHPGWLRSLRFAASRGIQRLTLQTNALLMTAQRVRQLQADPLPGLTLQISLDGASAASHDRIRGNGSFAACLAALDRMSQAGLSRQIRIHFTEMEHNLEEFPDLLRLAAERGVTCVTAGTLVRGGRARDGSPRPPTADQYLRLLERYDRDDTFRRRHNAIGHMAAIDWRNGDTRRHTACTFAAHPYLTADGRLYPCMLCHTGAHAIDDVFRKGLLPALNEGVLVWEPLLEISRKRHNTLAACTDCPGRACCASGCMGRAWASCGSPWNRDDRCAQRRAIYQTYPTAISASSTFNTNP